MAKNDKAHKGKNKVTKDSGNESKLGIQPLQDRLLIKEETNSKEQKTSFGMIIPAGTNEDKNGKKGTIVAAGKGRYEDGKYIPMEVKVGDKVLFQWGEKVTLGDEEYWLVREGEILAIIK